MIRVLFTYAQVKQYRLPFYTKLHAALLRDGIEMKVAYSDPPEVDKQKRDNVDLPAEIGIKVPGHWFFGNRFVYQALVRQALAADLVVAEQANRCLHEYILLLLRMMHVKRLAFWGLGANRDLDRSELSERVRPWIARRADWWFTYTKGTADWLAVNGVVREKITVVQNSNDTRALAAQIAAIPREQVEEARRRLGIPPESRVGIYCGILTPDKGVAFLLEAAHLIRERIANFHLLILGGGPERGTVQQATERAPWVHYLGPRFGEEKALLLKISDCFLLPGRVGLAILDAFAAGLPMITTNVPFHGPEVEYLEEGLNGKVASHGIEAYAETVAEALSNAALLEELKAGARDSVNRYSIEAMVERFRLGVLRCLNVTGLAASALNAIPAYSREESGTSIK